jgi:hypothetical protein
LAYRDSRLGDVFDERRRFFGSELKRGLVDTALGHSHEYQRDV